MNLQIIASEVSESIDSLEVGGMELLQNPDRPDLPEVILTRPTEVEYILEVYEDYEPEIYETGDREQAKIALFSALTDGEDINKYLTRGA
jgi:hypothetical protein